jgi:hypothetical protein
MGWDHGGRYYTRSRREGSRVVREYVGGGAVGHLTAQFDALKRQEREAERADAKVAQNAVDALDAPLDELDDLGALLVEAALVAAGYHRHNRGDWRKKREDHEQGR